MHLSIASKLAGLLLVHPSIHRNDHTDDPGAGPHTFDDFEFVNLAYKSEQATLRAELSALLKQFGHTDTTCPPPNHKGYSVLAD